MIRISIILMIHILFLILHIFQNQVGIMNRRIGWIQALVCVNFLAPIALVEYNDIFLELNGAWIVLPWCNLTFGSLQLHDYLGLARNVNLIWLTGFIWVFLGLLLIPTLKRSLDQSRWLFALACCVMVLAIQSLIVIYGYTLAAQPFVPARIYALPISSLFSIGIVAAHLSKNYVSGPD